MFNNNRERNMKRSKENSVQKKKSKENIECIRSFNRFYTKKIGVLTDRLLGTEYSLPEARVLFELNSSKTLSVTNLADKLCVDRGYISRLTTSLQKQNLIERIKSKSDGRVRLLSLSKEGKRAFSVLNRRSAKQVGEMLSSLTIDNQDRIISAMLTIHDILKEKSAKGKSVLIRPFRSGDIGWIVERHGALYFSEYDFDVTFETLVAEILAKLIKKFDSTKENIWIAEIDGKRVGSIVLAKASKNTSQLRLFLVEPWARGYGVGRALIKECIRFARAAGYKDMILWTQSILYAAAHLYREAGFKIISKEKHRSFGHNLVAQIWKVNL
jgi:DNA-binding MarR family transcriptional regulator